MGRQARRLHIVQAVLVRQLMPKLGEKRLIMIGLPLCVVGYLFFGLSSVGWAFLLGIPFLCLGGLSGPPAQGLMTKQVDPVEQGRLQGALTSLASLAGVMGQLVFANLFALFISDHAPAHLPGISFVLAAALIVIATMIAFYAIHHIQPTVLASSTEPSATMAYELSPLAGEVTGEPLHTDQTESSP
jgi:MFS transporter, DHA1 family, tetracycline resistance protein